NKPEILRLSKSNYMKEIQWAPVSGDTLTHKGFFATIFSSAIFPALLIVFLLSGNVSRAQAPTITLGANPTVCSSVAPTAAISYSATTGNPTKYSIVWTPLTTGFVNVTNAALPAGSIPLRVPAGAAAGTYTANFAVATATTP